MRVELEEKKPKNIYSYESESPEQDLFSHISANK
jgi:hypothetical protein